LLDRRVAALVRSLSEVERRLAAIGTEYATPSHRTGGMRDVERDVLEQRLAAFFVDAQALLRQLGWDQEPEATFARHARASVLQRLQDLTDAFRDLQHLRAKRDALRHAPRLWVSLPQGGDDDPWVVKAAAAAQKTTTTTTRAADTRPLPTDRAAEVPAVPSSPRGRQQQEMLQREREALSVEIHDGEYDAARRVEARMHQVTDLINTFATLAAEQHETVANLADTVDDVARDVKKGHDHLQRSSQSKTSFPDIFVAIVLSLTFALLLLDWMIP